MPKEALDYFKVKDLKVGFNHTDVWKEEHTVSFTIAKVTEEDILETVRDFTVRALEEGLTFEQFQKDVKSLLDKSGWSAYGGDDASRIKLIFDTNMRVARAAGQWKRIQRTKKVLPLLVYNLGPSVRHRPHHADWEGIILPVDDPWWDSHFTPSGHNCRCWISQIGNAEARRLGGRTERPPSFDVPHLNKKTGKVEQVPVGIQPGWDYNPGKDRLGGLDV